MPKLDRNNAKPLYMQLDEILRNNIANGVWAENERIPSECALSEAYGLSRMTVRAVITQLTRDGLLYRVQGKGTFVASPKISAHSPAYMGIREQLENMGYDTTTRLLRMERIPVTSRIRRILQLPEGAGIYVLERLRFVKEDPISLHRSFIPEHLAPTLMDHDATGEQLCVILDKHFGLKMKTFQESLEAVTANYAEAELFCVKRGYPLLKLEGISAGANDVPFEYTEILFRGDKVKLSFKYNT